MQQPPALAPKSRRLPRSTICIGDRARSCAGPRSAGYGCGTGAASLGRSPRPAADAAQAPGPLVTRRRASMIECVRQRGSRLPSTVVTMICAHYTTTPLQGDTAAGHSWPSIGGEYYIPPLRAGADPGIILSVRVAQLVDRLGGDGFWNGDYGWGVRVRRHFGARGMSSVRYGTRLGDLENKQSTHTLRSALWHEFQKHTKRDQNRCRSAPITDPLRSFEGSGSQTERERAEHTHTHTPHTHTHTSGAEGMYSLS